VHLSAIKLRGFKSFPDPVEIRLEPGVAVVVGPNGSGKSNVADGIVWAAGSLAPTELRAEKPDDVLFAGGGDRKPAEFCEVELLFDNADGGGPMDYSELSVARRLHRGGEGQYLVNRVGVRRIDVVELLADLGLGGQMHSIVGQGKVEEILASTPEKRREFVEEAAGLGRFKRRRHRAELKLARVEIQVERARDVEDEVRKRLRPLALQATAAERAERAAAELAGLRARIAELDLAGCEARLAETDERRLAAQLARRHAEERLEAVLRERDAAEEELADAAGRREAATAALYRLTGVRERLALRREQAEGLRVHEPDPAAARERATLREVRAKLDEAVARRAALTELSTALERVAVRRENAARLAAELRAAAEMPAEALKSARDEAVAAARAAALERDDLAAHAELARERLAALDRSLAEREGLPPAARAFAEEGRRLALDEIQAEAGAEKAVAASLGWRASALLADDPESGLELLDQARAAGLGTLVVITRPPALLPVVSRQELLSVTEPSVTPEGFGYDPARGDLWFAGEAAEAVLLELEARRRALAEDVDVLERRARDAAERAEFAAETARRAEAAFAEVAHLVGVRLGQLAALAERLAAALTIESADVTEELRGVAAAEGHLRRAAAEIAERVGPLTGGDPAVGAAAERLLTVLTDAEAVAERFEAPLRARVDAGGTRTQELAARLRELGAAEAELRRETSEAGERTAAVDVERARIEAEADEARRRFEAAGAEAAEGDDLDALAERAERLERRLESLGKVNPFAKEEYEAEKARLEELSVQREDLDASLRELEQLRDDLTETVERRFGETFGAVQENFAEVAATLFPGGEGRLQLVEDGIEVELRPAGKRITRLSLLSGGEKALGAISFLFALFLARPCPFYLLDEVEAALDDTNIGRFVELLRSYADRAQFVVITHQKRTMEAADVLYGVTMGADGISQVVSRRLPQDDRAALAIA
jgi:chromosome segregation protein